MREFAGLNSDEWLAIATFAGPLVAAASAALLAVVFGFKQFRRQQEAAGVRRRYLDDGVVKLKQSLAGFLGAHLHNYQTAMYLLRTVRETPRGDAFAPAPSNLPHFVDLAAQPLPLDALLPTQEILGDEVVLRWSIVALSDSTLAAREYRFQVRDALAAYYGADPGWRFGSTAEADRELLKLVDKWNSRVSLHFRLLDFLDRLESCFLDAHPNSRASVRALPKDQQIVDLREEMNKAFGDVSRVREESGAPPRRDAPEQGHGSA